MKSSKNHEPIGTQLGLWPEFEQVLYNSPKQLAHPKTSKNNQQPQKVVVVIVLNNNL
jgi:hypothetical protein